TTRPREHEGKKKIKRPPPPTTFSPPSATPASTSWLNHRRSDARIVENGFATSGGLSKSAKVVLVRGSAGRSVSARLYWLLKKKMSGQERVTRIHSRNPSAPG